MNLNIRSLKRMGLKPATINAIEKHMAINQFDTIEETIDSLGQKVGIKKLVQHTSDENFNTIGWTSTIRLENYNPVTSNEDEIDFKLFKNRPSAYHNCCLFTLRKQLLYLDLIPRLDAYIYAPDYQNITATMYFEKLIN